MQQKDCKQFSYKTRINVSEALNKDLTKCAHLLSKIERTLFRDFHKKNISINKLKSFYISHFGITARHFNSCRIRLQGRVRSFKELLKKQIPLLKKKIGKLKKHVKKIKDPLKKHQKKRRLHQLENKLEKLEKNEKEGNISICFGSKQFFRKQFSLEANDFASHAEWKKEWEDKRNDSFFLVGSKDETAGNQSCQISRNGDNFNLCVRLPNSFSKKFIIIEDITFGHGKEEILRAIEENEKRKKIKKEKGSYSHFGKALTYLFKKEKKGWTVAVSIEQDRPDQISRSNIGMIGVDINENHIAIAETNHHGNLVDKRNIPMNLYGKSTNQRLAIIGDAVKKITSIAIKKEKPLVIENLDFEKKKQNLREKNNKYSRMLSSLAYSKIISFIERQSFKKGIQIYKVNPAFTSMIGKVKFAQQYGLSIHIAAALAIARRPCRYSEKFPSCLEIDNGNSASAFFLPVRTRRKHGVL